MPTYTFECDKNQHRVEIYIPLRAFGAIQYLCEEPACGGKLHQIITAPLFVKASQDVCYDSPITGAPVTSWSQRRDDLARHNCIPYDPGMKQDQERRAKDQEEALDRSVEQHVEELITKMPTAKRNKLASDILDKGETIEYARSTPDAG